MRAVFIAFICLACVLNTWAQQTKTIYYNSKWEISSKEAASYYRTCQLGSGMRNNFFTRKVSDYTIDGDLIMSGTYSEVGLKTGEFILYYPSGQVQAQGNFEKGLRSGIWKYFFKNGKLEREIKFTKDKFEPISVYDSAGTQVIKDGTGMWRYEYEWYGVTERYIVTGKFEKAKKEDEWICKLSNGQAVYSETYKNDKFKTGWVTDGTKHETLQEPVENKFMLPYKFEVTESFVYVLGTERKTYPFLPFLPEESELSKTEPARASTYHDTIPEDQKVFFAVENPAEFPGGMVALMKFVRNTLRYPAEARRMGIEGNVHIKFIVDQNGDISNVEIVKGINQSLNEEAIRIVKLFPKWNPGMQNGRTVKSQFVLPIPFKLSR